LDDRLEIDLEDLVLKDSGGKIISPITMTSEERDLLVYGGRLGMVRNRIRRKLLGEVLS
jgi:hypothetical protein